MNIWIEPTLQGISLLFSLLFFLSFWSKMFSLPNFLRSITQLVAVPNAWIQWVAAAVLLGEAVIAISLSFFALAGLIFLLAIVMLTGFTIVLVLALSRKKSVQCSCFGESNKVTKLPLSVARNVFLIGLSTAAFFTQRVYPIEMITSPHFLLLIIESSLIIVGVKYGMRIRMEIYT